MSVSNDMVHLCWVSRGFVSSEFETSLVCDASHDVEGEVAHDSHVGGAMSGMGSRLVLAEGDVELPVQGVFDGPMAADCFGEVFRRHGPGRDVEPHSAGFLAFFPCRASHLGDRGQPREAMLAGKAPAAVYPVDTGGDADGALLDAAMALVEVGRGGGIAGPGIVEKRSISPIRPDWLALTARR